MRRNLILAVVVIAALTIAGVGGTFATWADSEISSNNLIETGSLDLKVNGKDDMGAFWGTGVGPKVSITHMIPCKVYGPFGVDLWNAGVCNISSEAYIHLKGFCCGNAPPKLIPGTNTSSGYWDPYWNAYKPEPELVAEYGGKVNCVTVPGINVTGDDCSMMSHVYCWVMLEDIKPVIDASYNSTVCAFQGKLNEMYCKEIYLFDLMPCVERPIYLYFHLQQDSEEDHGINLIKHPDELGLNQTTQSIAYAAALQHWEKFNDWPSWALMRDKVTFDLEFDLWLRDP
jgi:hypothetical protein